MEKRTHQQSQMTAYVSKALQAKIWTNEPIPTNNALWQTGIVHLRIHYTTERSERGENFHMNMKKAEAYRNEIKSYIVRAGMTMTEVVDYLADEYGWSASVPNLSGKLRRGSLRYGEAVELADALGYDIIWKKRER